MYGRPSPLSDHRKSFVSEQFGHAALLDPPACCEPGMLVHVSKAEEEAFLRELIVRAQAGEQPALKELFMRLAPMAFKAGRSRVQDADALEDLVHQTFIAFVRGYRIDGGSSPATYWFLKWTGILTSYFRKTASGLPGVTEPPKDAQGRKIPLRAVDPKDHPELGRRDRLDAELVRREWLLDWAPARDKIRAHLAESRGTAKQLAGWTRALDVVAIRALGFSFTDAELARELGCDPKQAARYLDHVYKLVRRYWLDEEEQS